MFLSFFFALKIRLQLLLAEITCLTCPHSASSLNRRLKSLCGLQNLGPLLYGEKWVDYARLKMDGKSLGGIFSPKENLEGGGARLAPQRRSE